MSIRVKCRATKIIHRGDNGYLVVSCTPTTLNPTGLKLNKNFSFTIAGSNFPFITEKKEYELEIESAMNPKYPESYNFVSCPSLEEQDLENLTKEESIEILLDCTSSRRIANNILDAYPDFIPIVLTEGKEAINTELIKGVGESYLNAYARELTEKYKYFHIMNGLKEWRLNVEDCKKLIDLYKTQEEIENKIKENPYHVLIEDIGRSFRIADRGILILRPDLAESKERCEALIIHVLRENESTGSTRLNGNELFVQIRDKYNVTKLIPMIKDVSVESPYIYFDEDSKDLSVMDTYIGEVIVSDFVKEKLANSTKLDIDYTKYQEVDGFKLTDMQLMGLKNFCESDISIISGVSGSGKTSGVKALVKLMEDNKMSYCLLSPTGSASLRLTTQTSRKASTIHRKVLRDKEINCDVALIDEMSMVGLDVFLMLIKAITNRKCRIVLCGDSSQIPSISKGTIFNDMIVSKKIPTTMLLQVFRYNTSGGSFVGENIRQGKKFLDNSVVKENNGVYTIHGNYKFIQSSNDEIFDNVLKEYGKLSNKYKLNDIIILSPFNKGECGTRAINRAIEDEYNPPKPNEKIMSYTIDGDDVIFRVGSRVVNIKNNYKSLSLESWEMIENSNELLTENDVPLTQLFNGEIGTVRSIDEKKMVVQFDEQMIVFTKSNIYNLLLARAISTHRSQGGEWSSVINVISPMHEKMLSKNLLYVSNTRGKEFHCDIGDRKTFENSLLIDTVKNRKTWMEGLLTNE